MLFANTRGHPRPQVLNSARPGIELFSNCPTDSQLLESKMVKQQTKSSQNDGPTPIAIIGLAFEFPQGATTTENFWQMICSGRSASTDFPPDRLNIDAFYHPDNDRPSTIPLRGGHFINTDLDAFDAPFFSITPGEAACMDPQHRRMLETAYHALEDGESEHCFPNLERSSVIGSFC